MRKRASLLRVSAVVVMLSLCSLPAAHADPTGTVSVSIWSESWRIHHQVPAPFQGSVTASAPIGDVGLDEIAVDVLIGGEPAARATTNTDGSFAVDLTFLDPGIYTVTAVVFAGTPLETRSSPFDVAVSIFAVVFHTSGPGRIDVSPAGMFPCGTGCANYFYGTAITATAVPNPGYKFIWWAVSEWSQPVSCATENPCRFVVAGDVEMWGEFVAS